MCVVRRSGWGVSCDCCYLLRQIGPAKSSKASRLIKKTLITTLTLLVVVYLYLAFVGIEPKDRRPGTLLSGTPAILPHDVSFVDDVAEITLETLPWYGIPFSVTAVVVSYNGAIYVPSLYDSPQAFPGTKYWNKVVSRNSDVRLRVGESVYELAAAPVLDDQEFRAVFEALGRKFPYWREQIELDGRLPRFALIRLSPR